MRSDLMSSGTPDDYRSLVALLEQETARIKSEIVADALEGKLGDVRAIKPHAHFPLGLFGTPRRYGYGGRDIDPVLGYLSRVPDMKRDVHLVGLASEDEDIAYCVPMMGEPGISARQASLRPDVPTETLPRLCDEGQLGTVGSNLRSGGIPSEAVERLERLYVSTSLLASKMGVGDGRNAAFLIERRGATVLRPNVRGTDLALRSDVDDLDPSLLGTRCH